MIYFLLAIYSAVFMSFIQVAGECFPVKKSFLFRFSECNYCQKKLAFYHIIPIFSFLFFRGKSRCCERPIPIIYFLMELVTPIYILLLYIQFSFSYSFLLYYIIYYFFVYLQPSPSYIIKLLWISFIQAESAVFFIFFFLLSFEKELDLAISKYLLF